MPKFEIEVASSAPIYATLRIEAENLSEAKKEALDVALNSRCAWKYNRANGHDGEVHIVSAEEVRHAALSG